MNFFHIIFNFIISIEQIITLKSCLKQTETGATKRSEKDITSIFTDAEI